MYTKLFTPLIIAAWNAVSLTCTANTMIMSCCKTCCCCRANYSVYLPATGWLNHTGIPGTGYRECACACCGVCMSVSFVHCKVQRRKGKWSICHNNLLRLAKWGHGWLVSVVKGSCQSEGSNRLPASYVNWTCSTKWQDQKIWSLISCS